MSRMFAVALGMWIACASGAGVYKAEYNTLDLNDHPMIVTNVTFDGLATTDEVHRAVVNATNNIPIPDMDQVISTNNPAFVAAVTNCPVAIDPEDASDLGDYGTYGTIGAILAALATGLAALKKGKQEKITASGILKGNGDGGVSAAVVDIDYQGVISDLSTIRSGAEAGATAVQPATLNGYAPKASPAFTGTPTAPTPTTGDNSTNVATTAFVQSTLTSALGDIESALHTINTGSAS